MTSFGGAVTGKRMKTWKYGLWTIAEDLDTAVRSFSLPQSAVTPITNWRWAETVDAGRNLEKFQGQLRPAPPPAYKSDYLCTQDTKPRTFQGQLQHSERKGCAGPSIEEG